LQNQPVTITEAQKQQFKQEIIDKFASLPLEQKQVLCVTNLLYQVIEYNWKRLSHEQQQAYKQQLIAQNVPPVPATPQVNEPPVDTNDPAALYAYQLKMQQETEYWTMMSNISLQSHVTSMNIIENIGGTGNYWEIVDY
jgi:transcription-repair coupling factor (superfamily II helicase)